MRSLSLFLAAVAVAVVVPLGAGSAAADSPPALTITATNQGGYDLVTVTSTGAPPVMTLSDDNRPPVAPGSGKPQPIGGATYYIHLDQGSTALAGVTNDAGTAGLPAVVGVRSYYVESELQIHVGLRYATGYTVSSDAHHLYIDVTH